MISINRAHRILRTRLIVVSAHSLLVARFSARLLEIFAHVGFIVGDSDTKGWFMIYLRKCNKDLCAAARPGTIAIRPPWASTIL